MHTYVIYQSILHYRGFQIRNHRESSSIPSTCQRLSYRASSFYKMSKVLMKHHVPQPFLSSFLVYIKRLFFIRPSGESVDILNAFFQVRRLVGRSASQQLGNLVGRKGLGGWKRVGGEGRLAIPCSKSGCLTESSERYNFIDGSGNNLVDNAAVPPSGASQLASSIRSRLDFSSTVDVLAAFNVRFETIFLAHDWPGLEKDFDNTPR